MHNPFAEFDPDLTQPRRFVPAPALSAQDIAALKSREKSLRREVEPILDELQAVRQQLATLPTTAY